MVLGKDLNNISSLCRILCIYRLKPVGNGLFPVRASLYITDNYLYLAVP